MRAGDQGPQSVRNKYATSALALAVWHIVGENALQNDFVVAKRRASFHSVQDANADSTNIFNSLRCLVLTFILTHGLDEVLQQLCPELFDSPDSIPSQELLNARYVWHSKSYTLNNKVSC